MIEQELYHSAFERSIKSLVRVNISGVMSFTRNIFWEPKKIRKELENYLSNASDTWIVFICYLKQGSDVLCSKWNFNLPKRLKQMIKHFSCYRLFVIVQCLDFRKLNSLKS